MNFFETESLTAMQAKEKAQWIAFAPFVFQTTRVLRDTGILKFVADNPKGVTQNDIIEHTGLTRYGVRVLVEGALGIGLLTCKEGIYKITKTTFFILNDKLTEVNLNFSHDVCYHGLFNLEESIRHEKPEGLKVFGEWPTIYEALSKLPPHVQKSWFAFDHFYSDVAFPEVLSLVYNKKPKTLLDIGGNTGKWVLASLSHDPDVKITIMDLPGQVDMARKQIEERGFGNRISFYPTNILDESLPFPKAFDAIWMSQFLDCFSDDQIKSILRRCLGSLAPDGSVYILEPFWDRQRFEISAFALQQTSIYFTAMANGNSQMYHSGTFIEFVEEAGLTVTEQIDGIGVSHTLLVCKPK